MSLYDETKHVQSDEAVTAARTILAADSTIVTAQGIAAAAHVFDQFAIDTDENPLPERYCVVRERLSAGGQIQTISGHQIVAVQVMFKIDSNLPNAIWWLGRMHGYACAAIVNQKPTLVLSTMILPFSRQGVPSVAALDDDTEEWYSTALYYTTLQPL